MRLPSLLLLAAALPVAAQPAGGGMADGHHDVIQTLIDRHAEIRRRVVDRPDGIESWTEADDPDLAALVRTHVRQMEARLHNGQPVRRWDPLTPTGIHVVETSDEPAVVALIRQHAHRAVSEFVAGGRARYNRATPPPGQTETPPATHPMGGMQGGMQHGQLQGGMGHGQTSPGGPTGATPAPSTATPAADDHATHDAPMPHLPAFSDDRHASTALFAAARVQVMGFAFRAGQGLPAHSTPADAFLLVTERRLRVTIGQTVHDLSAGEGVTLPGGVPHAIEAQTDARAALVRPRG